MPKGVYKRTAQANAATLAGRLASPKWRAAIRNKKKIRKMQKAAWKSERRMLAFYQNRKKSHESPKWYTAVCKALVKARKAIRRVSKPQRLLFEYLRGQGLNGLRLEYPVAAYKADIALPRIKCAVEVDGSYWHRINKTDYKKRDKIFESLGWKVLRLNVPFTEFAFKQAFAFFQDEGS